MLLCGLALAILVAILEFCWNSKKNAQTDRQSLCSEMAEELRFAMRSELRLCFLNYTLTVVTRFIGATAPDKDLRFDEVAPGVVRQPLTFLQL